MKYDVNNYSEAEVLTTTEEKDLRLSSDSTTLIFQMFSKNIYSNPIGSVVREITSNCFDSHVEAGVNFPVLIKKTIDKETDTIYISFIDSGVGMSPQRIDEIFSVLFKSTKRSDNKQIGAFGLGSKTPLAYKRSTGHGEGEYDNSYFIITNSNNVKYFYQIYEGSTCPRITKLHEEYTTEHNGTEIRIPVLQKDVHSFMKEMVRQLYYFENIIFEGFENETDYYTQQYSEILTNSYTIVRGKTFLFRGTDYSGDMHVCLGRVAYPIDYNVLGLNSSDYRMPVGLKLEVGEIGITVSRETLDYSESTIKILKKKLEAAKNEIRELLAKQYNNIVTLEDYFNVKNNFGVLQFANGMTINVGKLIEQKEIDFSNFKYSFMKMPNDKQLFKFFFDVKSYGKKPGRSRYSSKYEFEGGYDELQKNTNILFIEGEFNRKIVKQAYLKSKYELYHIISRRNLALNFMRAEISELFNVHVDATTDANGKPVQYVQSLMDMQDEFFTIVRKHAENYDSIEVPEDFILNRKNKKFLSPELKNTSIPVKFMGHYSKNRIKLNVLFDYNQPIFYGTQEDESKLRQAYDMYCALFDSKAPVYRYSDYDGCLNNGYNRNDKTKKKSIMFIVLAQGNIKYMQYCKKAYKVDQFFNKMLYRKEKEVLTYFQTHDIKVEWQKVSPLYKDPNFSMVNDAWGKKIGVIRDFIEKLPEGNDSIGHMKDSLSRYFDLTNIKQTGEQMSIAKLIADVLKLQQDNRRYVQYIQLPYGGNIGSSETLIDILQKVMVFV